MARNLPHKPFGTSSRFGLVTNDIMDMNMTALNKFGAKLLGIFFVPTNYTKTKHLIVFHKVSPKFKT